MLIATNAAAALDFMASFLVIPPGNVLRGTTGAMPMPGREAAARRLKSMHWGAPGLPPAAVVGQMAQRIGVIPRQKNGPKPRTFWGLHGAHALLKSFVRKTLSREVPCRSKTSRSAR